MKTLRLTLFMFSLVFMSACNTVIQDGITVTVDSPKEVPTGKTFEVVMTIENKGEDLRKLTSIDLGTAYLEGAVLLDSTPAYTEEWDFADYGFWSYDYYMDLVPDEPLQVTYSFMALEPGKYRDTFDVCIDDEVSCLYGNVSLEVL